MKQFKTVDEYFKSLPKEVRDTLTTIRGAILKVAPKSIECISYGMPAYRLEGEVLVYFAAQKHHIGFYPTSSGVSAFQNEITKYEFSKGTIIFPFNYTLPIGLIKKIVKFRIKEVGQRLKAK
jgi:uncharacterized protein YdhG (YjbR/CyaY superfamily)